MKRGALTLECVLVALACVASAACDDDCESLGESACRRSEDCTPITGRPLDVEHTCLQSYRFAGCHASGGSCGDAFTDATDPGGDRWLFNNTCIPADWALHQGESLYGAPACDDDGRADAGTADDAGPGDPLSACSPQVAELLRRSLARTLEDTDGEVVADGIPYVFQVDSGFGRAPLDSRGAPEVTLFYVGNAVSALFCPGDTEECLADCEEPVETCDGREIRSRGGIAHGTELELNAAFSPIWLVAMPAEDAAGPCGDVAIPSGE